MANEGCNDRPRSGDTRITIVSGRSRSVGNFRTPQLESGNRLREPRLSIGAGIRDLERRTAEVPTILRNNLNSVIDELRPIMERARNGDGLNNNVMLASWLGAHQTSPSGARESVGSPTSADDVVIDVDGRTHAPAPRSPTSLSAGSMSDISSSIRRIGSGTDIELASPVTNSDSDEHEAVNEHPPATTQVLNVNNSFVLSTFCKYLPILILIFTKFLFDHIAGIMLFVALFFGFFYYNTVIKNEVSRQAPHNFVSMSLYILHIVFGIMMLFNMIYFELLLHFSVLSLGIIAQGTYPLELGELLWSVVVTDFILKLITVIIKMIFSLLPDKLLPTTKRGKWYLFLETTSQLYRGIVPIHPWLHYLLESYRGPKKVIGVFLSAAYMVSKGNLLMCSVRLWWDALTKLMRNVTIGTPPTKEQIASAGNLCAICHDEFKAPVLLECQHLFCELCVCKWLDREQTCPLCRAKITDDPSWRDGSTTHFVQVF